MFKVIHLPQVHQPIIKDILHRLQEMKLVPKLGLPVENQVATIMLLMVNILVNTSFHQPISTAITHRLIKNELLTNMFKGDMDPGLLPNNSGRHMVGINF